MIAQLAVAIALAQNPAPAWPRASVAYVAGNSFGDDPVVRAAIAEHFNAELVPWHVLTSCQIRRAANPDLAGCVYSGPQDPITMERVPEEQRACRETGFSLVIHTEDRNFTVYPVRTRSGGALPPPYSFRNLWLGVYDCVRGIQIASAGATVSAGPNETPLEAEAKYRPAVAQILASILTQTPAPEMSTTLTAP